MRRDLQWRENLRREMERQIAADQGLIAHRLVARVVNGERTAMTASVVGPWPVDYHAPDDGEHHRALVASILHANMDAARHDLMCQETAAAVAAWALSSCTVPERR